MNENKTLQRQNRPLRNSKPATRGRKVSELVVPLARLGIADAGIVEHGVLALASPNKPGFGASKWTSSASGYQGQ